MKSFFINEAVNKALNDYLQSKENEEGILFNSFLVVVIRLLIHIYGIDLLEIYQKNNQEMFLNDLLKYGATKEDIDNLMRLIDGFYIIEKRNEKAIRREENIYFIEIQKKLIDLFNLKKISYGTTLSEVNDFYELLYTPNTKNPLRLSYNYLSTSNICEIDNYYRDSLNKDYLIKKENNYEINVENIPNNIYNKETSTNILITGNGYVDIFIVGGIIITIILIIIIFAIVLF